MVSVDLPGDLEVRSAKDVVLLKSAESLGCPGHVLVIFARDSVCVMHLPLETSQASILQVVHLNRPCAKATISVARLVSPVSCQNTAEWTFMLGWSEQACLA